MNSVHVSLYISLVLRCICCLSPLLSKRLSCTIVQSVRSCTGLGTNGLPLDSWISVLWLLRVRALQYPRAFQSSNLIGWIRVNLGCCLGYGTYVHIVVYSIVTNRVRALKSSLKGLDMRDSKNQALEKSKRRDWSPFNRWVVATAESDDQSDLCSQLIIRAAEEEQILASFPGLPTVQFWLLFVWSKTGWWEGLGTRWLQRKQPFISLQKVWLARLTLLSDIFEGLLLRSEPSFEGVGGGVRLTRVYYNNLVR